MLKKIFLGNLFISKPESSCALFGNLQSSTLEGCKQILLTNGTKKKTIIQQNTWANTVCLNLGILLRQGFGKESVH
jgi:hypothetical protein